MVAISLQSSKNEGQTLKEGIDGHPRHPSGRTVKRPKLYGQLCFTCQKW